MTNNPTEQQATPTSEEELREQVDALLEDYFRPHHDYIYNANSTNDFLDAAIHLIQREVEKAKIEEQLQVPEYIFCRGCGKKLMGGKKEED